MKEIKSFKLFPNSGIKSLAYTDIMLKNLKDNGLEEREENFDLAIAIGGDDSFLRMVKNCNFNNDIIYVGVNAGTLGFLQDIDLNNIEEFMSSIRNNNYSIQEIDVLETNIKGISNNEKLYSLNEIVVRDFALKTSFLDVYINDVFLEHFAGDGLLISSSTGSTAYNCNLNGSIVYNDLHTLQLTPLAPIYNIVYTKKRIRSSCL